MPDPKSSSLSPAFLFLNTLWLDWLIQKDIHPPGTLSLDKSKLFHLLPPFLSGRNHFH